MCNAYFFSCCCFIWNIINFICNQWPCSNNWSTKSHNEKHFFCFKRRSWAVYTKSTHKITNKLVDTLHCQPANFKFPDNLKGVNSWELGQTLQFLCFILTRWESNFTLLLCVYFLAIFYLCAISFKRISEVLIIRCCCCCILINDGAVNGSIAEIWENARIYQLGAH